MFIKTRSRPKLIRWLGVLAPLAFVVAVVLGRLDNPALDFPTGFLIGFSIVGNLAFLCASGRWCARRHDREGGLHLWFIKKIKTKKAVTRRFLGENFYNIQGQSYLLWAPAFMCQLRTVPKQS